MAATAFGKNRLFGMKLHAAHIIFGGPTILANAHIAGSNSFDRSIFIIKYFGRRKAWIDFNSNRLGLFNLSTLRNRMGNTLGQGVRPQRPPAPPPLP